MPPDRADNRGLLVWIRHQTGGFDRESLQWLLATLGVIASVTGVFQFILPDTSFWLGPWAILLMAAAGSAVGVTFRLVRRTITADDPSAHWRIHISSGDVLHGRPAVITTDTRRSFRPGEISPGSLIGQYLNSLEGQEARDTTEALTRLSEQGSVEAGDVHLMNPEAPSDTIWLLACGTPSDDGTVTTWSHLMQAYEGLWRTARRNHVTELVVPVIGAGFSHMNLSHSAVMLDLIMSFHAASVERPVCRVLRIVVSPADFDLEQILLMRRILAALHYRIKF